MYARAKANAACSMRSLDPDFPDRALRASPAIDLQTLKLDNSFRLWSFELARGASRRIQITTLRFETLRFDALGLRKHGGWPARTKIRSIHPQRTSGTVRV